MYTDIFVLRAVAEVEEDLLVIAADLLVVFRTVAQIVVIAALVLLVHVLAHHVLFVLAPALVLAPEVDLLNVVTTISRSRIC